MEKLTTQQHLKNLREMYHQDGLLGAIVYDIAATVERHNILHLPAMAVTLAGLTAYCAYESLGLGNHVTTDDGLLEVQVQPGDFEVYQSFHRRPNHQAMTHGKRDANGDWKEKQYAHVEKDGLKQIIELENSNNTQ